MKLTPLGLRCGALAVLAGALTLAACGGNGGGADDGDEVDSGLIADATLTSPTDANGDGSQAVDATSDSPPPTDANGDGSEPIDATGDVPFIDASDAETPDSTAPDAADGSPDAADGSPDATDGAPLDAASDGSTSDAGAPDAAVSCDGGFLDPTFGTCGIFTTSSLPALLGTDIQNLLVRAMVVQDTGNIVLAGGFGTFYSAGEVTGELPWVMRVLADGSGINPSFASGGALSLPSYAGTGPYYGESLVQQSDGKLLVSATCPTNVPGKTLPDICVTRLTADGALDSTYGSSGVAHVSLSSTDVGSGGVVGLDAQGLALLTGFTENASTDTAYLVRLTTAGVPDPTFNGGAPFVAAQASVNDGVAIFGVAALPSGRIFVAAGPELGAPGIQLAALTSSGAPDDTINPDADGGLANVVPLPDGFQLSALLTGPDDSVYAFGSAYPEGGPSLPAIVKVTPAGVADNTFGTAGEALFSSESVSGFEGAALEGSTFYATGFDFVSKIGLDGGLTTAWGSGGSVPTNWSPSYAWVPWLIGASVRGPLVPGSDGQTVFLAQLLP